MFIEKARGKMRQLRKKIISDMKMIGLLRVPTIERVQSMDDYCLLTSAGYSGRSLFTSNHSTAYRHHQFKEASQNLLMKSGASFLSSGARYEQARRVSRYAMFKERHDNRCTMLTFTSAAAEYQFIFNEIRESYLNMIG